MIAGSPYGAALGGTLSTGFQFGGFEKPGLVAAQDGGDLGAKRLVGFPESVDDAA